MNIAKQTNIENKLVVTREGEDKKENTEPILNQSTQTASYSINKQQGHIVQDMEVQPLS